MTEQLRDRIALFLSHRRKLVALVGAGISADSGVPTFRDDDGIWTIGSVNYVPQEMGTAKMLRANPIEVWKWKLNYNNFFKKAEPNAGHFALKELEDMLGDRFQLVTQNIDGLHFEAGSSRERTLQIHGSIEHTRCLKGCTEELFGLPNVSYTKGEEWTEAHTKALACPKCGGFLRPHVLLFDENYDDFNWESSLKAAQECGMLLMVGTTLATNLPQAVFMEAMSRNALCINVNPSKRIDLKHKEKNVHWLEGSATTVLPELVNIMRELTPVS